jgi:hypothetical protein
MYNMKPARPWMLAHLKIIWQFHQKVSRFFGPRYIGDDFFLGPNLVSFNQPDPGFQVRGARLKKNAPSRWIRPWDLYVSLCQSVTLFLFMYMQFFILSLHWKYTICMWRKGIFVTVKTFWFIITTTHINQMHEVEYSTFNRPQCHFWC